MSRWNRLRLFPPERGDREGRTPLTRGIKARVKSERQKEKDPKEGHIRTAILPQLLLEQALHDGFNATHLPQSHPKGLHEPRGRATEGERNAHDAENE